MFEGTPQTMLASINRIQQLPSNSLLFPGKERGVFKSLKTKAMLSFYCHFTAHSSLCFWQILTSYNFNTFFNKLWLRYNH